MISAFELSTHKAQFSIWKRAFFCKVKEIRDLSGGVVLYAAQSNPPIDAEIAEKSRFRTRTREMSVMITTKDFSAIKGSSMLQGFSDEDLHKLADFCEMREMGEGTTVFIENMPGESLFLIKKGTIRISRMFAEGDEKTLVVLGPEDVFGEMAVIDGLPRAATARVAEDTELISLKKKELERLCQTDAALAIKLIGNIVNVFSRRVREANDEYRDMLIWSMQKS
jgi:hypothetical protein